MHYVVAGKGEFMKFPFSLLASAIGLSFLSSIAHSADPGLVADASAFGARQSVWSVDISPSGQKLLMIDAGPGKTSAVTVVDVASGQELRVLHSNADPESLYWCRFASDSQIVCQYGGNLSVDGKLVGFSRLITVGTDGKGLKQLGQHSHYRDESLRQFDGDILDWLSQQGAVLMAREYVPEVGTTGSHRADRRKGLGVDKIDLATLKDQVVEAPNRLVTGYQSDGRGNVRLMQMAEQPDSTDELTGVTHYRYRPANSNDWKTLGDYDSRDGSGIYPLAIDADCNCAYVLRKTDGRDALYAVKLDGTMATSLVAANKVVDISSVVRFGRGQRVIGYSYIDDRRRTVYFDPEFQKLAANLAKALPKQPLINFREASADGSKLIILARGDSDPGTYYYYDKTSRQLEPIEPVRPALEQRTLAKVQSVTVTAGDGTQIPAYLTLPPTKAPKNLPAVVLPHGGPSSRDEWGFDWLAQFLAARGYAVIQPNYRGSAGYGDQWMGKNGFRDWRIAIGDVTASAKYLTSQGIADPNRLAIVGWSYGGYAALQSAAVEPALYKAAVAIAPVTDLAMLKSEAEEFTNYELVKDFVGSGPHVIEGSPLRHASEIKVPVLLFHGDLDTNVGFAESSKMADALQGSGGRVQFVPFKGLDHQLDDSNARTQMLTRIGEFLDSAIGH
jgi:dipeptidyl aminopeptidase/acylaminoacyl peptidase